MIFFDDELFPWWVLSVLNSSMPKSRYEILGATEPAPDPCPGEGKCHGCASWCAWCGSVGDVCDANEWPQRCDRHKRYPAKPEPPKPDPNQLSFPW